MTAHYHGSNRWKPTRALYSNHAFIYEALTLMKRNLPGDAAKAKQVLQYIVNNDQEGKEFAQEWLKKM